jgi:hypothetical protein
MLPNRIKAGFNVSCCSYHTLKLGKGSSLGWDHMKEIKAGEVWLKRTGGLGRLKPTEWWLRLPKIPAWMP